MKILILNGSPHLKGPTSDMAQAFMKGAEEAGHSVSRTSTWPISISGAAWPANTAGRKKRAYAYRRTTCRRSIPRSFPRT